MSRCPASKIQLIASTLIAPLMMWSALCNAGVLSVGTIDAKSSDLSMAYMAANSAHLIEASSQTKHDLVEKYEQYTTYVGKTLDQVVAQKPACAGKAKKFKQHWITKNATLDLAKLKSADIDNPDFYDDFMGEQLEDGLVTKFQEFVLVDLAACL